VKIIRFIDTEGGQSLLGAWSGGDTARVMAGDLFDAIRVMDRQARIARLLPPLTPPNILAIGLNYRAHAAEGHRPPPEKPLIFCKLTTSVIGPNDPIVLPRSAPDEVDFEAELGIVIGRIARHVSPERALDYVLGYIALNDVTARDCQRRLDQQWTRAKSFDTFCPLGPCLVTADAIDPANLRVRSWVNDELMQDGHTRDMIFPCAELVSYLSHQFTLLPGTLICTGTPAGVGVARTPPRFLRAGDRVTVEVDGVGKLSNRIVASS
jgi:2-keto-4-pentenoate hydratase/2-oxohepta-3-ene-1,7-dioic acid hydratase in catechol pathway